MIFITKALCRCASGCNLEIENHVAPATFCYFLIAYDAVKETSCKPSLLRSHIGHYSSRTICDIQISFTIYQCLNYFLHKHSISVAFTRVLKIAQRVICPEFQRKLP